MDLATAIPAFVALFVIIDPIGMAPLFVAMTQGMSARARRGIAIRACLVALALLTLFGLAGEAVLNFLGISMPAFRMAGGILLFLTALDMLFERRTPRRQGQAEAAHAEDPSVFPLAIPLIAGPGSITTMILLAGQPGTDALHVAMIHGVMALVLLCVFALFLLASPLERLLGPVGINVVTRILGMLLAALSVQFVIDGLRDLQVI
ncbi:NAAT family transporter [Roseobacter sp. HKCCD9010]|uniref:MarC family protein n=1 Tax=unclassified Roseobacter TaxID=196798 RepID=UPI001492563F|nr:MULTISPECIES: MarC family protein [unclassified Roseobacter]MBF9050789.1 NAAT family transporter [Rhodobacterales bacterium HKCCD4356]NNV11793.1 NAAT family transporter [Roseobacter sp. HKCCD7357]NNV17944.1 NAAT family transporter [Roseobacter sp. HKCCD8768]NNV26035.1 NAAT family transporter [Roseobacter sp. HKCCD8192]NNV31671.1 NAAT family transporter [Roseobacter sp. HKCCD9061]